MRNLALCQNCRRFVKNQNFRVCIDSLRNLYQLLFRDGKIADKRVGLKSCTELRKHLLRPLRHVLSVDKNTICQLVTHKDIVCNGQMIVQC